MTHPVERLLEVIETDIVPLTEQGVAQGNKVFGAAILHKADLGLVVAGTNEETLNPLLHGEISCLNAFWALSEQNRPEPKDCLLLSTHEPCSLCLSAITWSGFDNFYFLFSYEDSRDAFAIPHDLKILQEVFACENGAYRKSNAFWTGFDLLELIEQTRDEGSGWTERVQALRETYARLSASYQAHKTEKIPLN